MIRSMTGFVTSTLAITLDNQTHGQLHIIIKSLNARFFEATCRFPSQLTELETVCVKQATTKLRRGHVYITLYLDNPALLKGTVTPALNILEGYLQALEKVKQTYTIQGALTIDTLVQLPDVFYMQDRELASGIKDQILHTYTTLLDQLLEVQQREGSSLARDIAQRIAHLRTWIAQISQRSVRLIEEHKQKIMHMEQTTTSGDDQKMHPELAAAYALLDKIDIHEEIVRFNAHLESIEEQLHSNDVEKGKRLDFTLQELMREINTITAKSCDTVISKLAIDSKVELEKAREQVQNIV